MAILFNVTDAVSAAGNHGITRTERRLAASLASNPSVRFVVKHDGRLWGVGHDDVLARVAPSIVAAPPTVERFGIDPPPRAGRRSAVRAAVPVIRSFARRGDRTAVSLRLEALRHTEDDVLVSAGLDWTRGLLDDAARVVLGSGGRFVGFCYDMIPIEHPEWIVPSDPRPFVEYYGRMAELASTVVCISEHTRTGLLRHFPQVASTAVVHLGADAAIEPTPGAERFAASLFDGAPYAVYCSTIDRRKNHTVLYRAMQELAARGVALNLVLVGAIGSGVGDLIDAMRHDRRVAGRVVHVTGCDDQHLAAVYRRACFAVFPSLSEGWGLGVTEALVHGTPCLVASGSSLGEAGLGVCRELHPLRTAEWVQAMADHLSDPPPVPPVHVPTWDEAASSILHIATAVEARP